MRHDFSSRDPSIVTPRLKFSDATLIVIALWNAPPGPRSAINAVPFAPEERLNIRAGTRLEDATSFSTPKTYGTSPSEFMMRRSERSGLRYEKNSGGI